VNVLVIIGWNYRGTSGPTHQADLASFLARILWDKHTFLSRISLKNHAKVLNNEIFKKKFKK
jgi:hypothetical protein